MNKSILYIFLGATRLASPRLVPSRHNMSRQPTALADCERRAQDVRFARALELDHRRESEEAAKKRAVAQRCDYQSFHQLVAGARLSPMKKKWTEELTRGGKIADISRDAPHVDRRPGFHGGATIAVNRAATPLTASSTPTTLDEFHRSWRRLCGDDDARKTAFLLQLPIDSLQKIFKVRLSPLYFSIRVTDARASLNAFVRLSSACNSFENSFDSCVRTANETKRLMRTFRTPRVFSSRSPLAVDFART